MIDNWARITGYWLSLQHQLHVDITIICQEIAVTAFGVEFVIKAVAIYSVDIVHRLFWPFGTMVTKP